MPVRRIAHIVGSLSYGVGSVVLNYYRAIDKSVFQFDFFTYEPSARDEEIRSLGGRVFFMKSFRRPFSASRALYKQLVGKDYSAVHSHLNTLNRFALAAAEKACIPVRIAHNHSTSFPLELSTPLKLLLKPSALRHATHAAACSVSSAKWLFGRRASEAFIIRNAVDSERFKFRPSTREQLRKELKLDNKFVIGHAGRFARQKNHSFIIKTMSRICSLDENALLILAGDGRLLNKIQRKVKKAGLSDNVIFTGKQSDMENLYQAFDVFILPSYYEGLPLVAVEAQAAGLPVILSTAVTKEADICNAEYLDFAENWAGAILAKKDFERTDTSAEIRTAGFDIQTEAKKLEEFYSDII